MKSILVLLALFTAVLGCPAPPSDDAGGEPLVIFHNGTGPMCLDALAWLDAMKTEHPALRVQEHLTTQAGSAELLQQMRAPFTASQGVSTTFGYLPLIFYRGQAFSGFNDEVETLLAALIASAGE